MENKVYRDEDVSLEVLGDKVIAILGYGDMAFKKGHKLCACGTVA